MTTEQVRRRFSTTEGVIVLCDAEDLDVGYFVNASGGVMRLEVPPPGTNQRAWHDTKVTNGELRRVPDAQVVEHLEPYHMAGGTGTALHYRLKG